MEGYFYIIREREFIRMDEPVYKIGRTGNITKRVKQYPKGSELIISFPCKDMCGFESEIIRNFRCVFTRKLEYGTEYFEGDIKEMINLATKMHANYNYHPTIINEYLMCPKCGKKFKTEKQIARHINKKTSCNEKFICPTCNRDFKYFKSYNNHINKKNSCRPIQDYPVQPITKPNTCQYCFKVLSNKYSRNRHYKNCKIKNKGIYNLFKQINKQTDQINEQTEQINEQQDKINKLQDEKMNYLMEEIKRLKEMEKKMRNNLLNP